jgi:hypothetical protein
LQLVHSIKNKQKTRGDIFIDIDLNITNLKVRQFLKQSYHLNKKRFLSRRSTSYKIVLSQ